MEKASDSCWRLVDESTGEYALSSLPLTKKEEMAEHVKTEGSLNCSDHKTVDAKILRGVSKPTNSRITVLGFKEQILAS